LISGASNPKTKVHRRCYTPALSDFSVFDNTLGAVQALRGKELIAPGWITGLGPELVRCWVKDISNLGATLVFQRGEAPEVFRLYFSAYATTFRMCEVQWRKEDSVGVKFIGGIYRETAAVTTTAPSS
jgi:hypothetical protein